MRPCYHYYHYMKLSYSRSADNPPISKSVDISQYSVAPVMIRFLPPLLSFLFPPSSFLLCLPAPFLLYVCLSFFFSTFLRTYLPSFLPLFIASFFSSYLSSFLLTFPPCYTPSFSIRRCKKFTQLITSFMLISYPFLLSFLSILL